MRLPEATDINPAPDVIEINLDARLGPLGLQPGASTQVWGYDGGIPGPLIRAHVGDRLIVHFTNHLPEETTIHWHGIRLPADMDGVPDHSQPPVPPGGSFDYDFTLPDAGLFWYHPHVDSAGQVGNGLYGPLLVEANDEPAGIPMLGDQTVLMLSDIALNDDGSLADPMAGGAFGTLFGREGNVLLVNGRVRPTLLARRGLRQRWRIVNAAKSRYYQLGLEGHTLTRIGGDGGLIQAPDDTHPVVIIPGERADVLVTPTGKPGDVLTVQWIPYDRGYGSVYMRPPEILFYLKLVDDPPYQEAPVPAQLRTIEPIDVTGATPRDLQLTMNTVDGKLQMGINGVPSWEAPPLRANANETDVFTITNTMDWDHPFHLHGFFFQPLDAVTGQPLPSPEWKDTFNVPVHQTVKFAVKYDNRPGMWMFHCHILDHADAGMMGTLLLE